MVVYISGPMTGHADFNRPAFHEAANGLRELGYKVISPAELDEEWLECGELEWIDYIARDLKIIAGGVDAIALLPGWGASKGARMEVFLAGLLSIPVFMARELIDAKEPAEVDVDLLNKGMKFGSYV